MDILDTIPKDIHVIVSIPMREVRFLKEALDCAEFQGEGVNDSPAVKFVVDKFYPMINELVKNEEKLYGA